MRVQHGIRTPAGTTAIGPITSAETSKQFADGASQDQFRLGSKAVSLDPSTSSLHYSCKRTSGLDGRPLARVPYRLYRLIQPPIL